MKNIDRNSVGYRNMAILFQESSGQGQFYDFGLGLHMSVQQQGPTYKIF